MTGDEQMALVLEVLKDFGPMTSREIAAKAVLTINQASTSARALERRGKIEFGGPGHTRQRYVWMLK